MIDVSWFISDSIFFQVFLKRSLCYPAVAQVGCLKPEKLIPDAILGRAKGLAIITAVKMGAVVTYNVGTGLVVARREDGSWSPPSAISSIGMGWGAQVCVSTLNNSRVVQVFLSL